MPAYKVAFFFESFQQGFIGTGASVGWVETWYWQSQLSIAPALEDEEIGRYMNMRAAILDPLYRIAFIRISEADKPRRYKIAHVNFQGSASRGDESFAQQVQCAILVDLEKLPSADEPKEKVHHRRFLIRGLPPDVVFGNVLNMFGPNWPNILRFLNFIGNKPSRGERGAGMPARSLFGLRYVAPNVVRHIIQELKVRPGSGTTVDLTAANLVAALGDPVVVTGCDTPPLVNRTWKVVGMPIPGEPFKFILGTARRELQGVYTGPGSAKAYVPTYLYGPIDQYAIIGLRSKKTGRVFRQLRGRSRRA